MEAEKKDSNTGPDHTLSSFASMLLFVFVNFWMYFDRGAFAAVLDYLEKPEIFDMTNFQAGVVGGGYMIGFSMLSLVFGYYSDRYEPLKLMAFGLIFWIFSTILTGIIKNHMYGLLLIARSLTGIGEASFASIAPAFIDSYAPQDRKSAWLSYFYCMIPVGYALGNIFGGNIQKASISSFSSWRIPFVGEGLILIPFTIMMFIIKGPKRLKNPSFLETKNLEEFTDSENLETSLLSKDDNNNVSTWEKIKDNFKILFFSNTYNVMNYKNLNSYIFIILGYAASTFVTGGLAYFGVKYVQITYYSKDPDLAGTVFGAVTALAGILGSLFGGLVLEYLRSKDKVRAYDSIHGESYSIVIALRVICIFILIALPFGYIVFIFPNYSIAIFIICMFFSEFFMFATFSPTNSTILWSVPIVSLRPFSMAVSTVCIHILGDAISPPMIGKVQDIIGNWNISMIMLMSWLIFSVLLYYLGYLRANLQYTNKIEHEDI